MCGEMSAEETAMSPKKAADPLDVKNRLLEKLGKRPRIDGTWDKAVKEIRKQYDEVLEDDPYFRDISPICPQSADTSCSEGKRPLPSLADISVSPKHVPGFGLKEADPDDMPAANANELHGVTAVLGTICLEDHSKHKAATGPHCASGAVGPADHGEL